MVVIDHRETHAIQGIVQNCVNTDSLFPLSGAKNLSPEANVALIHLLQEKAPDLYAELKNNHSVDPGHSPC